MLGNRGFVFSSGNIKATLSSSRQQERAVQWDNDFLNTWVSLKQTKSKSMLTAHWNNQSVRTLATL